jgi:hypothetical protein
MILPATRLFLCSHFVAYLTTCRPSSLPTTPRPTSSCRSRAPSGSPQRASRSRTLLRNASERASHRTLLRGRSPLWQRFHAAIPLQANAVAVTAQCYTCRGCLCSSTPSEAWCSGSVAFTVAVAVALAPAAGVGEPGL